MICTVKHISIFTYMFIFITPMKIRKKTNEKI